MLSDAGSWGEGIKTEKDSRMARTSAYTDGSTIMKRSVTSAQYNAERCEQLINTRKITDCYQRWTTETDILLCRYFTEQSWTLTVKLSQRGLGQSPSRNPFGCILAFKSDTWWQLFKWFSWGSTFSTSQVVL